MAMKMLIAEEPLIHLKRIKIRSARSNTDSTPLEELAARHPRIAATCGAVFSFPSLVCYVAYTAAVFIEF